MGTIITGDVSIPRLGFGTFRMPGGGCRPVVESALALAYRHLDTAQRPESQQSNLDAPRWRSTRAFAGRARLGEHRHGDLGRNALDRRKHPVRRGNSRAQSRPGRSALYRPQRPNLALVTF